MSTHGCARKGHTTIAHKPCACPARVQDFGFPAVAVLVVHAGTWACMHACSDLNRCRCHCPAAGDGQQRQPGAQRAAGVALRLDLRRGDPDRRHQARRAGQAQRHSPRRVPALHEGVSLANCVPDPLPNSQPGGCLCRGERHLHGSRVCSSRPQFCSMHTCSNRDVVQASGPCLQLTGSC